MIEAETLEKFIDTARVGERISIFTGSNYAYLTQYGWHSMVHKMLKPLHDDYGWHFFQIKKRGGNYEYLLERGIGHKPRWKYSAPVKSRRDCHVAYGLAR